MIFVKMFDAVRRIREDMKVNRLVPPVLGGLMVGSIGLALPQVKGIGYEAVEAIVSGRSDEWPVGLLLALVFFKMLLTCVTLNSGGSGGVFVPSIYVGAALGGLTRRFSPA